MANKTFRSADGGQIRTVAGDNDIQAAALKKLGWTEITAKDIEDDAGLTVTYQTVTQATVPAEPPALPHLTVPVQPAATHDTAPGAPAADTTPGIMRDDVQPFNGGKK